MLNSLKKVLSFLIHSGTFLMPTMLEAHFIREDGLKLLQSFEISEADPSGVNVKMVNIIFRKEK